MQNKDYLVQQFLQHEYSVADATRYANILLQFKDCELHSLAKQFKDDEGWHAARAKGIGGSDIAAIIGESAWKSAYDIWLSKTGQLPPSGEGQQSEAARWGNVLEDSIANEWALRNNKKIIQVPVSLRSTEYPFMLANVDRFVLDDDGKTVTGILEVKTTSLHNKDEWEVGPVPYYYVCQATWYTMLTGFDAFDITCLVGGQHLYSHHLPRDPDLCKRMKEAAINFWEVNVKQLKEPKVTALDTERLKAQEVEKAEDAQPFIDESDETSNLLTGYIELRDKMRALEKIKQNLYAQIWAAMKQHDNMVTQSNFVSITKTTRRSCNIDMLQKEFPEAYDACVSKNVTTSLNIK